MSAHPVVAGLTSDAASALTTASPLVWTDAQREAAFAQWLAPLAIEHGLQLESLCSASSDASFRRYFRIEGRGQSFIIMDAPPPQEDVSAFVRIAQRLKVAGLNAPQVLAQDLVQGFLLLTDMGSQLFLPALIEARDRGQADLAQRLMQDAIAALVQWQTRMSGEGLPVFDDAMLRRELALFTQWCVNLEFGRVWSADEQALWDQVCEVLVASALAQPQLVVHRDYMPRNLMISVPNPAILDFQDAVVGPLSYDVASLIRDAFYSWEEDQELDIAVRYWQAAGAEGLPVNPDFGEFWRQLEWMGLQRHLKVLGIFCRLKHRDGKPKYSEDLPRFFNYAHRVASRYGALRPLCLLIEPLMGVRRDEAFC